ncbi:YeeE/YedE family protein [Methylococcus sp. EFPC2]|uniref:YeeE/YedE family protein n=1 Tax=Methylococcus sp. EFPC2 TaxID=2812648 RepID=UPI0019671170|nr:YeeE/YedE thiosulfate transporter family protein [Methylococcus sp. EFPC2]QSA95675.1 YeeE/YedE family protein [Methylococcus sp. EFPC2]
MNFDLTVVISALCGGLLIGLAVALFLLLNGRTAGISNIAAGLLTSRDGNFGWRALFIAGLLAGGGSLILAYPESLGSAPPVPLRQIAVAGLLVGYGARLANGCTSGHGVCGLSRLSVRSLVATGAFIVAGMVTVYVVRHAGA